MVGGTKVSQRKGPLPGASHLQAGAAAQSSDRDGARPFPRAASLRNTVAKGSYVELHLSIAVTALDAELLEVAEDVEQLPFALVHEDTSVELDELRLTPQREVDITNWGGGGEVRTRGALPKAPATAGTSTPGCVPALPYTLPRSAGAI